MTNLNDLLAKLPTYKQNYLYYDEWCKLNRQHQTEALATIENETLGQICLPTAAGKTRVQVGVHVKEMIEKSLKNECGIFVIAAHRLELLSQLMEDFMDLSIKCGLAFDTLFVGSTKQDQCQLHKKYREYGFRSSVNDLTSTTTMNDILIAKNNAFNKNRHLVVVSTYHSFSRLQILGAIDICTYDEAHVTIGEDFIDQIEQTRPIIKKNFFFTATRRVIGPKNGMNDFDKYGHVVYEKSPREMIDAGEIVPPKFHNVGTIDSGDFQNYTMFIRTVISSFIEHKKQLKKDSCNANEIGAKLLITTNGTQETMDLIKDSYFQKYCKDNNIKVFSFSSTEGYFSNFIDVGRNVTRTSMCSLSDEEDAILVHCDILTEGIDLPSITGVMPFRHLNTTKLLQTVGRGTRLLKSDRLKLYSGEIKAGEYNKFIKPFCYIVIPEHFYDANEIKFTKETISDIVNSYDLPFEDVGRGECFLANIDAVLPNITDPDLARTLDDVSALDHKFEDVLIEINNDKIRNLDMETLLDLVNNLD